MQMASDSLQEEKYEYVTAIPMLGSSLYTQGSVILAEHSFIGSKGQWICGLPTKLQVLFY